MKKNIAVVTGGDSSEEVISVKSARLILSSINPNKYNVFLVYMKNGNWSVRIDESRNELPIDKNDFSFLYKEKKERFAAAFLIIHGPPAENGKLQAYFDLIGIPYVGPKVLQASLTFNKEICKQYLGLTGIKSSKAILIQKDKRPDIEQIANEIGFPCFVKPNEAGSSFGVSKVYESEQLETALKKALTEDSSVMVEKFVQGTEVTCGVFEQKGKIHVLPVTEIVSTKDFFDYEAKYTPGAADEITPARISVEMTQKCREYTGRIYQFLNLSGFTRIDYIIADGEFYMLEVNTIPGMSPESIIPKQLREGGFNIMEVITTMIDEVLV